MSEAGNRSEAIAIIGMTGRFPGARSVDELWSNIKNGVESIRSFSEQELLDAGVDEGTLEDPNYVRVGTTVEGADLFDAQFFGFNAREAELTDPQHRIFLECAHEALEFAGYDPSAYGGLIGVYAGSAMSSYLTNNLSRNPELLKGVSPIEILVGNDKDFVPTRVSYKLNLRGPGLNVQTACSTSLVAVHLACQGLLEGACDIALAGGVSLRFPERAGYMFLQEGILSADGHCRPFDAKSAGTVPGVGAGVVVLKRLSEALEDGDNVLAIIRGSAINNDGSAKVGYTAPSVAGQAEVIAAAQFMAGVKPGAISYVETHGTGTHLGDPIEIAALTQAFGADTGDRRFCAIGSLKSNVGHMDAAAGVAGLIKTVLQLQHKQIVPTLHFETPNPAIDFENSPFYVSDSSCHWDTPSDAPRRAGVSSFGIGGTNAHVVLEEAPVASESGPGRAAQLLCFSAKTPAALENTMRSLANHIGNHSNDSLADIAYTLQVGRTAHPYRTFVVASDAASAVRQIESTAERGCSSGSTQMKRRVGFMFPGGGAQYPGMGRGLYDSEAVYRDAIDECSRLLSPHLSCDIRTLMYPSEGDTSRAAEQLRQTSFGLPALFATEFAIAQLMMSWGIEPDALIGHSLGEYVAACIAGVFSLPDALDIVAARSRLMEALPAGAMLSVARTEQEIAKHLFGSLAIVAINAPELCVVGGLAAEIDQLETAFSRNGTDCQRLHISVASHCSLVQPMIDSFSKVLGRVQFGESRIPIVSNQTGRWYGPGEGATPRYWIDHLRQTVRFADGISTLLSDPSRILVEIGPGRTLSTFVEAHPARSAEQFAVSTQRHPRDEQGDDEFLMKTIGRLWAAGVRLDWKGFHRGERRRRVLLPTYPFEKRRYFVEPSYAPGTTPQKSLTRNPKVADWFYAPVWKQSVQGTSTVVRRSITPSVLLFVDDAGVVEALRNKLADQAHVTAVYQGERFAASADGTFRIDVSDPADYERLFRRLAPNRLPDIIVHAWSLNPSSTPVENALAYGFHSLIAVAQGIGNIATSRNIQLKVLSNNIHRLTAETVCYPERATVLGPCKVIPQEYRNIQCQSIDLDLSKDFQMNGDQIDLLVEEVLADITDSVIAHRGERRWVQTFEHVAIPATAERPALLKQNGVYLITGGLKGIGLEIAGYLGKSLRASLVLVGRSEFPPRAEWTRWQCTRPADDPANAAIETLLALEGAGAQVLTVRADVTAPEQARMAVQAALGRFGRIDGIIHAAGLPGGGLIQLKTSAAAAEVLAPKITGTLNLCSAVSNCEPSFIAMCSSMSSILGGAGHVDYCAANAFMDAFAHARASRHGTHFLSINWNTWKGIGMAATVDLPSDMLEWKRDIHSQGLSPQEGIQTFARIMNSRVPQIAVCTLDLPSLWHDDFSYTPRDPELNRSTRASKLHDRPNLEVEYAAPDDPLQKRMAEIWESLLGIGPIGMHDNFFALGGHSLLGTRLMSRVREEFAIEMPLRSLFERPTIEGLCERVAEEQFRAQEQDAELLELLESLDEKQLDIELVRRLGNTA